MPYCYYCGDVVKDKRCTRCYHLEPGYFRKDEHPGDCGLLERFSLLAVVFLVLYFASGFIFKILNLIVYLLNH